MAGLCGVVLRVQVRAKDVMGGLRDDSGSVWMSNREGSRWVRSTGSCTKATVS